MRRNFVQIGLLSCAVSWGANAVAMGGLSFHSHLDTTAPSLEGIVLAQAPGDTSTDQAASSENKLTDAIDPDLPEELLAQFLADPAAFISNPDNAEIIAAVVRQVIAQDPSNMDVVIASVDGLSDSKIMDAVADGMVRAAADYAAAGDTAASSQILAKASIATSTALRQAVQTKTSEIASPTQGLQNESIISSEEVTSADVQEGEILQESEATLSEEETLSEPVTDAPALSTTAATTGGEANSALPASGTSQPSPANLPQPSPITPPPTVTPPPVGNPASPA